MTVETVTPADAALLREMADDMTYGTTFGSLVPLHLAARLRALAEVLEREEKERAERTVHCWECGQPVKPI